MENSNKKKEFNRLLIYIVVIFVLVILILSAGAISIPLKETKNEISEEEKERLREEERHRQIITLKAELATIESEIDPLDKKILNLKGKEKKVLLIARIVVGLSIIALDYWYYKSGHQDIFLDLLKFNSALVSVYSFIAFICHGTPSKFATFLKSKIRKILHWHHRQLHKNFEILTQRRNTLIEVLNNLEKPVLIETKDIELRTN